MKTYGVRSELAVVVSESLDVDLADLGRVAGLNALALLVRQVGDRGVGQIHGADKSRANNGHVAHIRVREHLGPSDRAEAADVLESLGREVLIDESDIRGWPKLIL